MLVTSISKKHLFIECNKIKLHKVNISSDHGLSVIYLMIAECFNLWVLRSAGFSQNSYHKFVAVYFLFCTVYPQCDLIPASSALSFSGPTLLVHADSLRELQKGRTDWKQAVLYQTTVPNPDTDTLFFPPTLVFICSSTQWVWCCFVVDQERANSDFH